MVSQTVVLPLVEDKNWNTVNRQIYYAPIFLFEAKILLVKWHVSHPWLRPEKDVWYEMKSIILYSSFWLIPRRLNFMCWRFGNCSIFTRPMKMEQCFDTSTHKIQTLGNHSKEIILHSQQGGSLKSRKILLYSNTTFTTRRQFEIKKNSVIF